MISKSFTLLLEDFKFSHENVKVESVLRTIISVSEQPKSENRVICLLHIKEDSVLKEER